MKLGPFEINLTAKRRSAGGGRQSVREFGGIQYVGDLILQLEALQGGATSPNRYVTRDAQIDETIRKYRGQAAKGNLLVRNILNTRAAFTSGRGLNLVDYGEPERRFIDTFFLKNRANLAYLRRLARERCYEGQVLLALNPDADNVPLVRYISWYDTRYEVLSNPLDYATIRRVYFLNDPDNERDDVTIDGGRVAFLKFDTRETSFEGTPLLAGILNQFEDLDDALALFRTINTVAAKPSPVFECQSEDEADKLNQTLTALRWKMGDALATNAKPSMLQIGYGPYSSLVEHIIVLVKMISGHTGVPPQYWGFADLLNNRSTAEDVGSMFVTVSETETDTWGEGFTDLIGRAMAMYNTATASTLNHQTGRVEIEVISREQFQQVADVWLPAFKANAIDLEEFLSHLPGVDQRAVLQRMRNNPSPLPASGDDPKPATERVN